MISVALHDPKIPQNTGNIARLAVGLDIELLLVGKLGFSLSDKYLKRAGLDYWEYLKFEVIKDLDLLYKEYNDKRIILVTTKGINPYYQFDFKKGDILLFGSEIKGLPGDLIKENINNTVTIPMPGNVRSLNLSNSAAIVSYHALYKIGYFNNFKWNKNYIDLMNNSQF